MNNWLIKGEVMKELRRLYVWAKILTGIGIAFNLSACGLLLNVPMQKITPIIYKL
jgi:hypothetical protein